jgi:hypothetical protein
VIGRLHRPRVGAIYWGAQIVLDLLEGRDSEAADRREGRRALWLGALDRLGLGFGLDT